MDKYRYCIGINDILFSIINRAHSIYWQLLLKQTRWNLCLDVWMLFLSIMLVHIWSVQPYKQSKGDVQMYGVEMFDLLDIHSYTAAYKSVRLSKEIFWVVPKAIGTFRFNRIGSNCQKIWPPKTTFIYGFIYYTSPLIYAFFLLTQRVSTNIFL